MGSFATRLHRAMFNRQMTTESLSMESGYSIKYITELRTGKKKNPTIQCVECLAQVLDIAPEFLAGWLTDQIDREPNT